MAEPARSERTRSPEETEAAGGRLAGYLGPGDVVLVSGELGSGKTTFVRGALRALGVSVPVTSPTFTIGHLYAGRHGPVAHLDLYRLSDVAGEDPGLLDAYLSPDAIAFVEWPERGAATLPGGDAPARHVVIRHAGADERLIEVR